MEELVTHILCIFSVATFLLPQQRQIRIFHPAHHRPDRILRIPGITDLNNISQLLGRDIGALIIMRHREDGFRGSGFLFSRAHEIPKHAIICGFQILFC